MEKLNINCQGGENIFKSICWILSIISWLLFLITGWIAIFGENYNVWTIPKHTNVHYEYDAIITVIKINIYPYIPIQIEEAFIYIIFILTLGIATAGFIIYLINSIFIKTSSVFNGMMGMISRFHFISFICGSALFIIGEEINDSENQKDLVIASLIFSIIGLISLILSYFKTIIEPCYASLLIKKGTFSCLIALYTYNICYIVLQLGVLDKINNISAESLFLYLVYGESKLKDFINNCGIALPIVIGLINIALSIALKDIMISAMNLIIFIGMTTYYYNITEINNKYIPDAIKKRIEYKDSNAEGIIDIIMIVLSSVTIGLLIIRYKTSVFK